MKIIARRKFEAHVSSPRKILAQVSMTLMALTAGLLVVGLDSAEATAVPVDAIAYGTVLRAGNALQGADVVALAWPTAENSSAAADGADVDTTVIGFAVTDSQGHFEIDADPSLIPATDMDSEGQVLVQLQVADDTNELTWFYTARYAVPTIATPNLWNAVPTLSSQDPSGPYATVDLATGVAYDASDDPANWVDDDSEPLVNRDAGQVLLYPRSEFMNDFVANNSPGNYVTEDAQSANCPGDSCTCYNWGPVDGTRYENFLNVYSWSGAPVTVAEGAHSTHTLGMEGTFSWDSWAGAKAVGSITLDNSNDHQVTASGVLNRKMWNTMVVRIARLKDFICQGGPKRIRQASATADMLTARDGSRIAHHYLQNCYPHDSGTWSTGSATAVTHAFGFEIDLGIHLAVKAQSGYKTDTSVTYNVNSPTMICGNRTSLLGSSLTEAHDRTPG